MKKMPGMHFDIFFGPKSSLVFPSAVPRRSPQSDNQRIVQVIKHQFKKQLYFQNP
jgi:hypothetical protein